MAISLKTKSEIDAMRKGGRILAHILDEIARAAKPGIKTSELDALAHRLCIDAKVKPAFLGYTGYPSTLCVSVNDEVVHGIPGSRVLNEGDLVGLDMGIILDGWNLDSAVTVEVKSVFGGGVMSSRAGYGAEAGTVPESDEGERRLHTSESRRWRDENEQGKISLQSHLVAVTRNALYIGIEQARAGNHVGDIGYAVQTYVEKHGFGVVRDLVGHGIGRQLHEEPNIPNFGKAGEGTELRAGMVICIEPMITAGDWHVAIQPDKWTYKTKDGSLSAHFEHTIAVTRDGPQILTKL